MTHPRSGDTVRVHYTGRLDDGRVFASSRAQEPLELTVGEGTLLPSVEETLTRMEPGEERTVTIPAERAHGPYEPELVLAVDRAEFPEDIEPEVGQELQVASRTTACTDLIGSQLLEFSFSARCGSHRGRQARVVVERA
jgi:FKBP-type peptidyl-prolyl cis-trans isomerase 2